MISKRYKRGLTIIPALALPLLLWAVVIEPRLIHETQLEAVIPSLPEAWQGKKIAFITDLQIGIFLDNSDTATRVVERIIGGRPEAVLLGGDFIYHPTEGEETHSEAREEYEGEDRHRAIEEIGEVTDILRPLSDAGLPVYAVLGNHDYAMETQEARKLNWVAEELTRSLRSIGISVLHNTAVDLRASEQDEALMLLGIGPYYPGEAEVQEVLADIPRDAPRIVLLHNPEVFPRFPPGQAPFALAGHTHGGQIRIPFLESWSWIAIVREGEVHTDGWIRDYGQRGNSLYVNRGIGFSLLPVRLNCRPELTWVTLRSK